MGFCISKAAASAEIVETITESLSLTETPVPKKIARLFLVSDILHNSSATVPNASSYRSGFQATLSQIFMSLHTCYKGITSRMGLETMKDQVVKLLHIWQAWSLFPLSFVMQLERILLYGSPDQPPEQPAAAEQSELPDSDSDVDGEPMARDDDLELAAERKHSPEEAAPVSALAAQDARVRQLSLREIEAVCEVNGLSSAGSRAEMMQRVLLALHAGVTLDLDAQPAESQTLAVATRWDDDEDAEGTLTASAPTTAKEDTPASPSVAAVPEEDLDGDALGTPNAAVMMAEASLSKEVLRDLEVKVMNFSDSLEGMGRSREWVMARVAEERSKLVLKAHEAVAERAAPAVADKPAAADKQVSTGRDRERGRDSSKGDRDSSKGDRDSKGEKDRDRRDRERAERRDREREEEKRRDKDKDRGRDRDRDRDRKSRRSPSSSSSDSRSRRSGKKRRS